VWWRWVVGFEFNRYPLQWREKCVSISSFDVQIDWYSNNRLDQTVLWYSMVNSDCYCITQGHCSVSHNLLYQMLQLCIFLCRGYEPEFNEPAVQSFPSCSVLPLPCSCLHGAVEADELRALLCNRRSSAAENAETDNVLLWLHPLISWSFSTIPPISCHMSVLGSRHINKPLETALTSRYNCNTNLTNFQHPAQGTLWLICILVPSFASCHCSTCSTASWRNNAPWQHRVVINAVRCSQ
jgi:hypothetical protein